MVEILMRYVQGRGARPVARLAGRLQAGLTLQQHTCAGREAASACHSFVVRSRG
jgi:hypothetical protein